MQEYAAGPGAQRLGQGGGGIRETDYGSALGRNITRLSKQRPKRQAEQEYIEDDESDRHTSMIIRAEVSETSKSRTGREWNGENFSEPLVLLLCHGRHSSPESPNYSFG